MDSWIWYQVSLELGNIDVEGTIESEGSGQRGDNLGNESVQVGVSWSLDIEISSADIIDGFVIKDDGNIGMLEEGMGGED
jgi:hypothetical protein